MSSKPVFGPRIQATIEGIPCTFVEVRPPKMQQDYRRSDNGYSHIKRYEPVPMMRSIDMEVVAEFPAFLTQVDVDNLFGMAVEICAYYDGFKWHPPKGDRFTTYETKDEMWMRPLGLGSVEPYQEAVKMPYCVITRIEKCEPKHPTGQPILPEYIPDYEISFSATSVAVI